MKNIFENEEEQGPGSWIAADKDIVVIPQGSSTVEDAVKALEDKSNYGMYKSAMADSQAKEDRYGPPVGRTRPFIERTFEDAQEENTEEERIQKFIKANKNLKNPEEKYKTLRDNNGKFPLQTKTDMDNFLKSRGGKPNLVAYTVVGDTLVFPNSKNTSKGRTQSIVATVMDNAGINYTIKQKESFKESQIKAMIREEIRNVLKENFESFDNLESAIKHHEKGDGYYDRARLITIFNQLKASDQQKARTKYSEYFGKKK